MIISTYEKFGRRVDIARFIPEEITLLLFADDIHIDSVTAPDIMTAEIMAEDWILQYEPVRLPK